MAEMDSKKLKTVSPFIEQIKQQLILLVDTHSSEPYYLEDQI